MYTDDDITLTKSIIEAKIKSDAGFRPIQLAAMSIKYPGSREIQSDLIKTYVDQIVKLWEEVQAGVEAGDFGAEFVGKLPGFEVLQAATQFTQLTMDLLRSPITLKIKTIPMFHISHSSVFLKPVVVYINSNDMVKPFNSDKVDNFYDRVMNGLYIITGFKHFISATRAYSQFVLIRDPFEFAPYIFDNLSTELTESPTVERDSRGAWSISTT